MLLSSPPSCWKERQPGSSKTTCRQFTASMPSWVALGRGWVDGVVGVAEMQIELTERRFHRPVNQSVTFGMQKRASLYSRIKIAMGWVLFWIPYLQDYNSRCTHNCLSAAVSLHANTQCAVSGLLAIHLAMLGSCSTLVFSLPRAAKCARISGLTLPRVSSISAMVRSAQVTCGQQMRS